MEERRVRQSILLAVDDSETAGRAVDYVGSVFSRNANGVQVTLLHIVRRPEGGAFATDAEAERYVDEARKRAVDLLARYRCRLVASGIPERAIHIKCPISHCPSIAEAILAERDRSGHSTIVVGRHHLTRAEEFLYGSVSGRLISNATDCAVWVIA